MDAKPVFATPVMCEASSAQVYRGRAFRPPMEYNPDGADTVPGMEVALPGLPDFGPRVYACFDGVLSVGAWDSLQNRLRLDIADPVLKVLRQFADVEAAPKCIVYENVDPTQLEATICDLLFREYQKASTTGSDSKTWHPMLRQARLVTKNGKRVAPPSFLMDSINEVVGDDNKRARIKTLIQQFMKGDRCVIAQLSVRAGDHIAVAGDCNPLTPAVGAEKRVVFCMLDGSRQYIDPLYYIHRYVSASGQSKLTLKGDFSRIISAFTELAQLARPPAHTRINGQRILAVTEELQRPHKRFEQGLKRWYHANTEQIQRENDSGPLTPSNGESGQNAKTLWEQLGGKINRYAAEFDVPCEIPVSIFTMEGANDAKAGRIEVLTSKDREQLSARPDLIRLYDKVCGSKVISYKPLATRELPDARTVVTDLECTLEEVRPATKYRVERTQFLLFDGTRRVPIHKRVSTTTASNLQTLSIADEQFAHEISQPGAGLEYFHPAADTIDPKNPALRQGHSSIGGVGYHNDRAGRVRVVRAKLKQKQPFDVIVSLVVEGAPGEVGSAISITIPAGRIDPEGWDLSTELEVPNGASVAIRVQRTQSTQDTNPSIVDLSVGTVNVDVRWYRALAGAIGEPYYPTDLLFVDGGKSTGYSVGGVRELNEVPVPWNGSSPVRNGHDLTWEQLADIIDLTNGNVISLGPAQMKIIAAVDSLNWLNSLGVDSSGLTAFQRLQIDPPPAGYTGKYSLLISVSTNATDQTPWLLRADNSMAMAVAKMRNGYRREDTAFDLFCVSGSYNGGLLPVPTNDTNRDFAMKTADDYLYRVAGRYNVLIDYFNHGSPNPQPSVRMKR